MASTSRPNRRVLRRRTPRTGASRRPHERPRPRRRPQSERMPSCVRSEPERPSARDERDRLALDACGAPARSAVDSRTLQAADIDTRNGRARREAVRRSREQRRTDDREQPGERYLDGDSTRYESGSGPPARRPRNARCAGGTLAAKCSGGRSVARPDGYRTVIQSPSFELLRLAATNGTRARG